MHRFPGSTWLRKRGAIFQEMSIAAAGWELVCLSALWSSLLRHHCSQIGRTNLWASWGWEHFELMWRSVKTGNGHPWPTFSPPPCGCRWVPIAPSPTGHQGCDCAEVHPCWTQAARGEHGWCSYLSSADGKRLCRAPPRCIRRVSISTSRFLLQDPLSRLHVCLLCLFRAL